MKQSFLAIGIVLGFLMTIASTPVSAFGFVSGSIQYNSGSGVVQGGNPVEIHQYPNGRVVVHYIPVTRVYPNGESLIYQNGGQRVYTQGYGGAATCYVACWQGGVRPNRGSGSSFSIGIGIQKTW